MSDPIGFIGAGQMGEPMVHRLLAAGRPVTVYARRDEVRQRLADAGATVVDSVADVGKGARTVICCMFSDAQLKEVAEELIDHCAAGTVVLSHTTGSVSTVRDIDSARADVTVLDAPISGTAEDIANGRLTVLIGGPADAVETAAEVVQAYAATVLRTGLLGTALNLKLVNNVLFAANAQLLSAAVGVAGKLDIEADRFLEVLAACSADSKVAGYARGIGGMAPFTEMAAPFLRKDVDAALAAAQEAGTDLGLLYDVIERGELPLSTGAASAK
ncbi:NAD(P)-dependent oxidoreductase [Mycolicibacterium flavescens]|uniref:6-phosphogluconate dehydrogenase n=1 Tax=Mycolicibacterium flavescens TaxID=1776 RepID=A0A1E3RIX8_MYCFV|nr:NAD(P)-binding domain-containing protein [Mycolicibacterium flavescens]MCV7280261.1 NAD(P)-dependent oxidoreductase [Mycolicibacterium flavescens]ODQ89347.1 6-phosphogluconate dehydrogenase [Mycolicibacterium flavescens]